MMSKTELLKRSQELQWKLRASTERFLAKDPKAGKDLDDAYNELAQLTENAKEIGINLRDFGNKYNNPEKLINKCRRKTDKC